MEENKMGSFQKGMNSRDGKNLINLRQAAENFQMQAGSAPAPSGEAVKRSGSRKEYSRNFLDRISESILYLLAFLMPLLVLPVSFAPHEFTKTFLLYFLAGILLFVWTFNQVFIKGQVRMLKTPITGIFILFVLIALFSAVFSIDQATSFLGYYGTFSDSFMFLLALFVVFFLGGNIMAAGDADRVVSRLSGALMLSALFAALSGIAFYAGKGFWPGFADETAGFNPVSDYTHSFAVYLLAMFFVVGYDFSYLSRFNPMRKRLALLAAMSILLAIVLTGWSPIFVVFFAAMSAVIVFGGFLNRQTLFSAGGGLMVLALALSGALALTGLDSAKLSSAGLAFKESSLSSAVRSAFAVQEADYASATQNGFPSDQSREIASASFKARPILGSGIGTYAYDFSKYKTADFNYDDNYLLHFGKAYNEMLEKVSTLGAVGLATYLVLLLAILLLFVKVARREKRDVFLLAAFAVLVIGQFLFAETAAVKFLLVALLLLALGRNMTGDAGHEVIAIDLERSRLRRLSTPLALALILAASASLYFSFRFCQAESLYKKIGQTAEIGQVDSSELERMLKLNPYKGEYAVLASRIHMARIEDMFQQDPTGQSNANNILAESDQALSMARRATDISPNIAPFWENFGFIYRKMRVAGMKGAEEWALKGFQTALSLDPYNPVYQTEIGKMYLVKYQDTDASDEQRKSDLNTAEQELQKAIDLKNDYPDAMTSLALAYSFTNDREKSLAAVDSAKAMKKISPDTAVQMARIYYNFKEYAQAEEILLAVIAKNPDNSDAHYVLGVVYKDQKKYEQSLSEFKKVLSANRNSEDVSDKISELERLVSDKSNFNPNIPPEVDDRKDVSSNPSDQTDISPEEDGGQGE